MKKIIRAVAFSLASLFVAKASLAAQITSAPEQKVLISSKISCESDVVKAELRIAKGDQISFQTKEFPYDWVIKAIETGKWAFLMTWKFLKEFYVAAKIFQAGSHTIRWFVENIHGFL